MARRTQANIKAIKLLKQLEAESRLPNAEEKRTLAAYSGWGSMGAIFDEKRYDQARNRAALKQELTDEEWESARGSTLNAHFTSGEVISAMWKMVERLGFKGGRILEPSAGAGSFFALQPEHTAVRTERVAVELDSITGRILKNLYPQADVRVQGFQESPMSNNSFDMAISNVPFGSYRIHAKDHEGELIHDYFFLRALDKVKPGGLVVFITSDGTMDKSSESVRNALTERADLVGAIRLPNTAFVKSSGTSVTTDIVILRKKDGSDFKGEPFGSLVEIGTWDATKSLEQFDDRADAVRKLMESGGLSTDDGEDKLEKIAAGKRKLQAQIDEENLAARKAGREPDQGVPIRVNEYFARHPEMALGTHSMAGEMYGDSPDYALLPKSSVGNLGKAIEKAMASLPENVMGDAQRARDMGKAALNSKARYGSTAVVDGEIVTIMGDQTAIPIWMTDAMSGKDPSAKIDKETALARRELAVDWMPLRDAAVALVDAETQPETTDDQLKELRAELNRQYDAFRAKYGTLNRTQEFREPALFLRTDPDYYLVQSLEIERVVFTPKGQKISNELKALSPVSRVMPDGTTRHLYFDKHPLFTRRVNPPTVKPDSAANLDEAIDISMGWTNQIRPDEVAALLKTDVDSVNDQLSQSERVFMDPESGMWTTRARYLSGAVKAKLVIAEEAMKTDPSYKKNVDALRAAIPADVMLGEISMTLAAKWIPDSVLSAFAKHFLDDPSAVVRTNETSNSRSLRTQASGPAELKASDHCSAADILSQMMQGTGKVEARVPEVRVGQNGRNYTVMVVDKEATALAETRAVEIGDRFRDWILTTDTSVQDERGNTRTVQEYATREYNDKHNAVVPLEYDGSYLALPGLSTIVNRLPHRMSVIARILNEGAAVMAHGVGSGKTFSQIVTAMEMKRMGLAKKSMIVVAKPTVGQFAKAFREAYPNARVIVADEASFTPRGRKMFMAQAALSDADAIIVTQPQFERISLTPEAQMGWMSQQIREFRDALDEARAEADEPDRDPTVKRIEAQIKTLEAKLLKMRDDAAQKKDQGIYFEHLGVDFLLVDEAHAYKKPPLVTRLVGVKGVPTGSSQRALNMGMITQWIQARKAGRGVVFATGTPITNTLAEVYVMLKLATPNALRQAGINSFDAFAHTFAKATSDVEYTPGGKFKYVTRLKKFVNGPELSKLIRSGFDVKMGNKELGLEVPDVEGEGGEFITMVKPDANDEFQQVISAAADEFEGLSGEEKRDWKHIPLVLYTLGARAAVDMRLVNPDAADDPDSKINRAVAEIADIHQQWTEKRGTQLVFLDRFADSPNGLHTLESFLGGDLSGVGAVDGDPDSAADNDADLQVEDDEESSDEEKAGAAESKLYKKARINLYHDMRDKLIARGVKPEEIAIMHDYDSDAKRVKLFEDVNAGRIRILMGSTGKMGTGVNVQERVVAMHHIDPPSDFTPASQEQREGRAIRQQHSFVMKKLRDGRPNPERIEGFKLRNIKYGYEASMDTAIWQLILNKMKFSTQALKGNLVGREFDDPNDSATLSLAQFRASLTGDDRVLQAVELEQQVRQLEQELGAIQRMSAQWKADLDRARFDVYSAGVQLQEGIERATKAEPFKESIDAGNYQFEYKGKTYQGPDAMLEVVKSMQEEVLDSQNKRREDRVKDQYEKIAKKREENKSLTQKDLEWDMQAARTGTVRVNGVGTFTLQVWSKESYTGVQSDGSPHGIQWVKSAGGDLWHTDTGGKARVSVASVSVDNGGSGLVSGSDVTEEVDTIPDMMKEMARGAGKAVETRRDYVRSTSERLARISTTPQPVFAKADELALKRQQLRELNLALTKHSNVKTRITPSGFYVDQPIMLPGNRFYTIAKVSEPKERDLRALVLRDETGRRWDALKMLQKDVDDPIAFMQEAAERYWQLIQPQLDAIERERMSPTEIEEADAAQAVDDAAASQAADRATVRGGLPSARSIMQAAGGMRSWGGFERLSRDAMGGSPSARSIRDAAGGMRNVGGERAAVTKTPAHPIAEALIRAAGRLESWATRQAEIMRSGQGMARRVAGARSGHNTILTDVLRLVGIVSARGLSRGITKGIALTKLVNSTIAELAPDMASQAKAIRRGAKRFLKTTNRERFERDFAALVAPKLTKRVAKAEADARAEAIAQITDPTSPQDASANLTKTEALKVSLKAAQKASAVAQEKTERRAVREIRKQMRRAFNLGAQAGRREARERLKSVYRKVIAFRHMLAKWDKTRSLDEYRRAQAVRDGIRNSVKEYARTLPKNVRGKLLGAITAATTPTKYLAALRMLETELNKHLIRTTTNWIARATRRAVLARGRGMTDPLRAKLTAARARAAQIRDRINEKGIGLNELVALEAEAEALKQTIGGEIKAARDAIRAVKGVRAINAVQAIDETLKDVEAARKPVRTDNEEKDTEVSAVKRVWRGARDIRNAIQEITGRVGSVMEKVWYDRFERAEAAMLERKREVQTYLDVAFRRAGFKSLADAQRAMSGYGGDGNTRLIEGKLGGEVRRITLGELVDLIGHWSDPMTRSLIEDGQPFQSSRGRRRPAFTPTAKEVEALIAAHDPAGRWRALVEELKAVTETLRPDAWKAFYTLQGYEPEAVPGRWPRARNLMAASVTAELPTSPAMFGQKFLENDGMFEARNQTTGVPILLQDPVSMMLDQTDRTLRTIHLAIPTRDASHLVLEPKLAEAITARWGASMVDSLARHLVQMSRAQVVAGSRWGQFVARLRNATVVGQLAFNVGTWAVTTISALRVLPMIGARDFAAGVAALKRVDMAYIQDRSGYFWDRYANNRVADRYAAAAGAPTAAQDNAFLSELVASFRNLKAKDVPGAWASLGRAMQTTMAVINWTDSISARIAWGAFEAKSKRKHPNWSDAQREKWVEFQTRRAIREAQQGHSPIDMAIGPASVRETGNAAWFLFTSDVFKSRNRIVRAFRHSKARGTAALAAEVASVVIGGAVRSAFWWSLSAAAAAAFGSDDDDRERIYKQYLAADKLAVNAIRELSGTVLPMMGPKIVDFIQSPMWAANDRVVDAPVLSSIDETVSSAADALRRSLDDDENAARALVAWGRFLNSASGASGRNPFAPILRRVLREADQAAKD